MVEGGECPKPCKKGEGELSGKWSVRSGGNMSGENMSRGKCPNPSCPEGRCPRSGPVLASKKRVNIPYL